MDPSAIDMLIKMSDQNISRKFKNEYRDLGFIFVNKTKHPGYPLLIKHIESRMARILALAGIDKAVTLHSLRHTHASLLAEAGVILPKFKTA